MSGFHQHLLHTKTATSVALILHVLCSKTLATRTHPQQQLNNTQNNTQRSNSGNKQLPYSAKTVPKEATVTQNNTQNSTKIQLCHQALSSQQPKDHPKQHRQDPTAAPIPHCLNQHQKTQL